MATLTNTQISVTYVGLLKTSANTVLTSTAQQITDGDGNNSIMFLSTAGVGIGGSPASGKELDVTGNVLVTGDLQVDNINIDANTISATSGVVTLADGAIATTQSQNDNSTKIATTAYVDAAVDSVDTLAEVLAIGNTTGATKISVNNTSSGIDFIDDALLRLGTGNDLVIRHDASNSHIENATGILNIEANNLRLGNFGTDDYIIATNAGSVELYHNDVKKLETTSTGATILNNLTLGSTSATGLLSLPNNGEINLFNANDDKKFTIRNGGSALNTLIIELNDGTDALTIANDANATFAGNVSLADSKKILLGNSSDLEIYHDGSNSFIENSTGIFNISQKLDDGVIKFNCDDGSGGTTRYIQIDGSVEKTFFFKAARHEDNVKAEFGSSGDLEIYHDGSNSYIDEVGTGSLFIRGSDIFIKANATEDAIIARANAEVELYHNGSEKFATTNTGARITSTHTATLTLLDADDSSEVSFNHNAGVTTIVYNDLIFDAGGGNNVLQLDGTTAIKALENITLPDSKRIKLGTGEDLQIFHNGTSNHIEVSVGDLFITNFANDKDIAFFSDDGSGGTTEYFRLDGSGTKTVFSENINLADSKQLDIGSSGADLRLTHSGTDSFIQNFTGDLQIQQQADDKDILFRGDDGSGGITTYFRLDGGEAINVFSRKARFLDNVQATFGDADDFKISHDGSDTYVQNVTSHLIIENQADDKDIIFKSDNGGGGTTEYLRLDGSDARTIASREIRTNDGVAFKAGNSGDFAMFHDGTDTHLENTTGDLTIQNGANDKDIIFKSDDGSGSTTEYFRLDGSEVSTKILTQKVIMSNLPTSDPANAGQLYNDSGTLKISAG